MILLPLVALSLVSCTTFSDNDAAIRVDDVTFTHEELAEIASAFGLPEEQQTNLGDLRSIATALVNVVAVQNYLSDQGIELTEAQLADATTLMGSPQFDEASARVQTALVDAQGYFTVLGETADPALTQSEAIEGADIYIDPRIGTYDPDLTQILPLG